MSVNLPACYEPCMIYRALAFASLYRPCLETRRITPTLLHLSYLYDYVNQLSSQRRTHPSVLFARVLGLGAIVVTISFTIPDMLPQLPLCGVTLCFSVSHGPVLVIVRLRFERRTKSKACLTSIIGPNRRRFNTYH